MTVYTTKQFELYDDGVKDSIYIRDGEFGNGCEVKFGKEFIDGNGNVFIPKDMVTSMIKVLNEFSGELY